MVGKIQAPAGRSVREREVVAMERAREAGIDFAEGGLVSSDSGFPKPYLAQVPNI